MTAFASPRFATRLCLGLVAALAVAAPALAQPASSSADSAALSDALRTLARSPNSVEALLAAGQASLRLEDEGAALGFFRRAQALNPQDARAKGGLGAVMVRQRQPLEALRLFAEAEQAGALSPPYIAERGLAYDLIGDNARAQRDYTTALATGANPVVSRRLALSQAIAGDQRAAEATLLPLLQHQDLAAYRTRAFTLAIGGRGDEAVSIAETMLPATLSNRMAPYLRYMPRLTRAQQAAAADLGAFPRAGDIGRDDPQIAAYAATLGVTPAAAAQTADARLVPSGAPLGRSAAERSRPTVAAATPAPQPGRPAPVALALAPAAVAPTPTRAPVLAQASPPRTVATSGSDALPERARAMLLQHPELTRTVPGRGTEPAPAAPPPRVAPTVVAQQVAPTAPPPRPMAGPVVAQSAATPAAAPLAPPATIRADSAPPTPVAVPPSTVAPESASGPPAQQAVVVATLAETGPAGPEAAAPPATSPAPPAAAPRPSLSEAFGDLRAAPEAPAAAAAGAGAVDITKIQPRRPTPAPKPAPPKPPPVPSREWVQVATGRSTGALAFDWRRLKKEAGGALDREKPSTAEWGRTNRLVVGPFASVAAADKMVSRLKDKKIDAFRFTSDEGQDVGPLE